MDSRLSVNKESEKYTEREFSTNLDRRKGFLSMAEESEKKILTN